MSGDWSSRQSTPAGQRELKIHSEAHFASELAEAVPAESDCLERKSQALRGI